MKKNTKPATNTGLRPKSGTTPGVRPKVAPLPPPEPLFFLTFKFKLIVLAVVTLILYVNTINNGHCLDDGIVIENNTYVLSGFSGIGKIMTTDAYDSYYKKMSAGQQLSGGRYRPLSEVVFAIEHAIFGEPDANSPDIVRHFVSVMSYVFCVLIIFYFLAKYLLTKFRYGEDMAFLAALIFAIHPIHTEVVANIKSLDEILSIIFICLTFIFCLRYMDSKKPMDMVAGAIFYFLSLLAKEYAIMLVVLLPLLIYLLRTKSFEKIMITCLPYIGALAIYLILRGNAVGFHGHVYGTSPEILDDPYMLATHSQKTATEYYVLLKYLKLLIFPYPLVSDYSYAQIPYQNMGNFSVILSILITYSLLIAGIVLFVKRNVLSFPIFFYLLNLAIVSNLLMDIGATMGERLIFHSSLGFAVLVSYGVFKLIEKWKPAIKSSVLIGLSAILFISCGYETIKRNKDWQNDITLFTHDVHYGPNSIMLNGNAGARFIDLAQREKDTAKSRALIDTSIIYLRKSIFLHKRGHYIASYINMGDAYFQLHNPDSAKVYWDLVSRNYKDYPGLPLYDSILARLFLMQAEKFGKENNYTGAIKDIKEAIGENPRDADLWYNLGGIYFTIKKYDSAYYYWQQTLRINPNNAQAKQGLAALTPVKQANK